MEKKIGHFKCVADDGRCIDVIEYQHFQTAETKKGVRNYPGARWLMTAHGERVRYIDKDTFEIIASSELIFHDGAAVVA